MKKWLLGFGLALLPGIFSGLRAQRIIHEFELSWPLVQVKNSLYSRIELIDSRTYTQSIGTIQYGISPGDEETVVFKTPIQPQLTGLIHVLTDSTAKDGILVFQLRRFRFVETSDIRHCYLSASLYARKGERYIPLSQLDTMIPLTSAVWKNLQSNGNSLITDFISKALLQPAADTIAYTLGNVQKIDSIEKRSIPLYYTAHCTDGIYRDGGHFLRQQPDWTPLEARTKKDGSIMEVSALYPDGTKKPIKNADLYAVVYKGSPYLATEYGYFPLQKLGDDWYSVCDLQMKQPGLFGNSGYKFHCQLMIDHRTGEFIIVRQLNTTAPTP